MIDRDKFKRANTYFVLVPTNTHDLSDLNSIEEFLVEFIGGFTDNEYIFRQYQKFYEPLLNSNCSYVTTKYENVTLAQLTKLVGEDFAYHIDENDEMLLLDTPNSNVPTFYTYRMIETIDEYCYDGADPLDDIFLREYMQFNALFSQTEYFKEPIIDNISSILDFCKRYTVAIKKSIAENFSDGDSEWVPFDEIYNWVYQREFILRINTQLLDHYCGGLIE